MPEVFLDGENVDFQGPAPETANAVWGVLENYLASQGRLIASFEVDEVSWVLGDEDSTYTRVVAKTESQAEKLASLAESVLKGWDRIDKTWTEIGTRSLSADFIGLQKLAQKGMSVSTEVVELGQYLAAFGENEATVWHSELRGTLDALNAGLSHWMNCFEAKDVIGISDSAVYDVQGAFQQFRESLGKIVEDLENRKDSR